MLELAVESWIWFAFVMAVAIARFVSRTLLLGSPKKLQVDDWVMIFALITYTTMIVSINIVADYNSNLLPPDFDMSTLTNEDIDEREYGSKMILVVEQCQIVTIWAVKACLLIMYYRLTVALKENLTIKVLAGYVAFAFVLMEILYLGVWCRPFSNYWAVPTPNIQCNAATNHLITNAVFNLSSDLILLTMALQMLVRSRLPLRRKLILCCVFGLGIFVILSAVLNKYYSFSQPFGSMWTFWYVREASTALLVGNLPFTWTLLRRVFKLNAFENSSRNNSATGPPSVRYHTPRTARSRKSWQRPPPIDGAEVDTGSGGRKCSSGSTSGGTSTNGSVGDQNRRPSAVAASGRTWRDQNLFGRADAEALEPWDYGEDIEMGMERAHLAPERTRHLEPWESDLCAVSLRSSESGGRVDSLMPLR
ncbi:hypothetical protein H2201_005578 [Coniosporium apollinis]|uniref:Rhodopsin domain-containing protein n=1 Tax=Coniosporium apollinis TaxID=61459 RepID=A0ABQ9NSW7_9PEZI|nr:hypothetical protein H2201_005578 [Coniosporium apollinis]